MKALHFLLLSANRQQKYCTYFPWRRIRRENNINVWCIHAHSKITKHTAIMCDCFLLRDHFFSSYCKYWLLGHWFREYCESVERWWFGFGGILWDVVRSDYLSMMTGSDGVSFRLPQLFFSQQRLSKQLKKQEGGKVSVGGEKTTTN